MNPRDYYYNHFRTHVEEFVGKSSAHEHPGEGIYIPIQDLNNKNLSHVPADERMFFHCALACTVLIDQVMYTHFKDDYSHFRQMTLYPKIEYGITNINVKPWTLIHGGVGLTTFEKFAKFFVEDLKEFFTTHKFHKANWSAVKLAMLGDKDVVSGSSGEIFTQMLNKI